MPERIDRLAELFLKFPGIGPRQSKRFVYFLLSQPPHFLKSLTQEIERLREGMSQCTECFRYFEKRNTASSLCALCSDPNMDPSLLLILEKDLDLETVRKSGVYHGRYFILGGPIPVLESNPEKYVRLVELKEKVRGYIQSGLSEIILGSSATPSGDHTKMILREQLSPLLEGTKVKVSELGRGLSTGTELEYSDADTLRHALSNRG